MDKNMNKQVEHEAMYGVVPMLHSERQYGFWDTFLVMSGYAVATWCYTQGAYLATFLTFKQLLTSSFGANTIVIALLSLPTIFAVRYGIDTWIWCRAVFGIRGVKIIIATIILINFPWYAVTARIFATSMINMISGFGIAIPDTAVPWFALFCIVLGTLVALAGPGAIAWSSRILVTMLLIVGVIVVYIALTSVPMAEIWAYKPDISNLANPRAAYMISVEGNIAFAISWTAALAVIPRLCKRESHAYWGNTLAYGVVAPFFIVAGGAMAIVMYIKFGIMTDDPSIMLAKLGGPVLALLSLLLVAFANIGSQTVGTYVFSVVLKASFPKVPYKVFAIILMVYAGGLALWGRVMEFFGAFISFASYIYGPVMALLFVDYFFVRKGHLALRDVYGLSKRNAYHYNGGFNIIGLSCVAFGIALALAVYDPLTAFVKNEAFYYLTASGTAFIATGILYFAISKVPFFRRYLLKDKIEMDAQLDKEATIISAE
jgi:NCS1 family nucleobase:cation symporter-1